MNLSESAQEVLERLWIVTEEEGQPGLAAASVDAEAVEELVDLGLVERSDGKLCLIGEGYSEAALAARRHRLAERLLADVLATPETVLDEQACRFEHFLLNGTAENICTLLGHPRFCPHGKPIPPGECCEQSRHAVEPLITPLSELVSDEGGRIAYIRLDKPKRLQKLMAMGVLPGVPIKLLRRFPSYVFEAGYSQFAVDEEIAADIYVRVGAESGAGLRASQGHGGDVWRP